MRDIMRNTTEEITDETLTKQAQEKAQTIHQYVKPLRNKTKEIQSGAMLGMAIVCVLIALFLDVRFLAGFVAAGYVSWYIGASTKLAFEYIYKGEELMIFRIDGRKKNPLTVIPRESIECVLKKGEQIPQKYDIKKSNRLTAHTGSSGNEVYTLIYREREFMLSVTIEPSEKLSAELGLTENISQ